MSRSLAKEIKKVQKRFEQNREDLDTIEGLGGALAYDRSEVRELLDFTNEDLLGAIARVREGRKETGLVAMEDWVREEFRLLREKLDASNSSVTARLGRHPRVVALVASLGSVPGGGKPSAGARILKLGEKAASGLLDGVEWLIDKLLGPAKQEKMQVEVKTWSQPRTAKLELFPPAEWGKSHTARSIPGWKKTLWRGLYLYNLKTYPYENCDWTVEVTTDHILRDWYWKYCPKLDLMEHEGREACIFCDLKLGSSSCELKEEAACEQ